MHIVLSYLVVDLKDELSALWSHSRRFGTYALQRPCPVARRLLDAIAVSLAVLVVVGMACNIARSIVSISGAKQVRRKRTSWTWPWRRERVLRMGYWRLACVPIHSILRKRGEWVAEQLCSSSASSAIFSLDSRTTLSEIILRLLL